MSTSAISAAATSALTGATGANSSTSQLGQDDFLKLMLSQMKNQDPFKPQDPGAFIAQLAQFSTVSSSQAMQKDISSLSDSLRSSQVIDGTSLVGHNVMAATDSASLGAAGSVDGAVNIPDGTSSAMLTTQTGLNAFSWDGNTDSGTRAAAGTYHIAAVANVGGANQQVETQMASVINSVTIDPTSHDLTLNTDFGPIALKSVRRVM